MILTASTDASGTWVAPSVPADYDAEQADLFASLPPVTRDVGLVYDRAMDRPVCERAARHVPGRHLHVVPDPPD